VNENSEIQNEETFISSKKPHCFQIDKQVKGEANLQKINNN